MEGDRPHMSLPAGPEPVLDAEQCQQASTYSAPEYRADRQDSLPGAWVD